MKGSHHRGLMQMYVNVRQSFDLLYVMLIVLLKLQKIK